MKRKLSKTILCTVSIGSAIQFNVENIGYAALNSNYVINEDVGKERKLRNSFVEKSINKIIEENLAEKYDSRKLLKNRSSKIKPQIIKENNLGVNENVENVFSNVGTSKNNSEFLTNAANKNVKPNKNSKVDVKQKNDIEDNIIISKNTDMTLKQINNDIFKFKRNHFLDSGGWNSFNDEKNKIEKENIFNYKKISRNEEIVENDSTAIKESEKVSIKKLTVFESLNNYAPVWVNDIIRNIQKEEKINFIPLKINNLTRREAAILTMRMCKDFYKKEYKILTKEDLDLLVNELLPELKSLGYEENNELQKFSATTKIVDKDRYKWRFSGDIRYSYMKNSGADKFNWNDSKIRMRVNSEKAINDKWQINTMTEANKDLLKDFNNIRLRRYYFKGLEYYKGFPLNLEIGHTSNFLGKGNIFDADYKGVKSYLNIRDRLKYYAGWGKTDDNDDLWYSEYIYRKGNKDFLGGLYRWDNSGNPDMIYMLGMDYYLGKYVLGGMYLKSSLADEKGNKDGEVFSLTYGKNFEWIKDSYEISFKYYNMPQNTYITHTMSGLADYMEGFSGWSIAAKYTILNNIMLGLEYYDLKDKITGEKGKTVWLELTYSWD